MEAVIQTSANLALNLWAVLYIVNRYMYKGNIKKVFKFQVIVLYLLNIIIYILISVLCRLYMHEFSPEEDIFLFLINSVPFINHIAMTILFILIYRRNISQVLISLSGMYILSVTFLHIINGLMFYQFNNLIGKMFLFSLIGLVTFWQIKKAYIFINFFERISRYKHGSMIIPAGFVCDFLLRIYRYLYDKYNVLIIDIALVSYILFFSIGIWYILKIKKKSNIISKLNQNLDIKNNKLRIIKQNHEKQMFYLNYLSDINDIEKLGEYLKEIINVKSEQKLIEKERYKTLILNLIAETFQNDKINLTIEEKFELSNVKVPEIDLYRIMINIINNAVKAIEKEGKIIIETYKENSNAVVSIANNGPEIKKSDLKLIFKEGFTTKKNESKSHGFGLNIVKELVEKNNGKISVESNKLLTKFKLEFPIENF